MVLFDMKNGIRTFHFRLANAQEIRENIDKITVSSMKASIDELSG